MKVDAFVESITWTLHPTFKNPKQIKLVPPFTHSCPGCWGYFDLPFEVKFKPWTKLPILHLNFELEFDELVSKHVTTVKITRESLSKKYPKLYKLDVPPPIVKKEEKKGSA